MPHRRPLSAGVSPAERGFSFGEGDGKLSKQYAVKGRIITTKSPPIRMATTQETPTVTSEKPDTPGTYVPDEVVTEIVQALDEQLGPEWCSLFDDVEFSENMERSMMRRACIAAKLSVRLPEKDWSRIADPSESPDLEEFIYLCIPASFHYTPNFTSDTPGYCGTIFHIQWGGGPSYLSNVTRPRIDGAGNKLDYEQGFNCYALDPS